jgi:PIN domain nuclease of toxin-antitoxin system
MHFASPPDEKCGLTFSRDPFDVSIVATAKLKDLPLITKDEKITESGVVAVAW